MTPDKPGTEFWTIKVHNFKDDPYAEGASLHGLFTDKAEAERVNDTLRLAYPDFLSTSVTPIQAATVEQIAHAQGVTHIEPATAETYAQIREVVRKFASRPDDL